MMLPFSSLIFTPSPQFTRKKRWKDRLSRSRSSILLFSERIRRFIFSVSLISMRSRNSCGFSPMSLLILSCFEHIHLRMRKRKTQISTWEYSTTRSSWQQIYSDMISMQFLSEKTKYNISRWHEISPARSIKHTARIFSENQKHWCLENLGSFHESMVGKWAKAIRILSVFSMMRKRSENASCLSSRIRNESTTWKIQRHVLSLLLRSLSPHRMNSHSWEQSTRLRTQDSAMDMRKSISSVSSTASSHHSERGENSIWSDQNSSKQNS